MLNAVTAIRFGRWITSDNTKPRLVVGAAADYEGSDRLLQDPVEGGVMPPDAADIPFRTGGNAAEATE